MKGGDALCRRLSRKRSFNICFHNKKKTRLGLFLLWCSVVDELLNSIVDETSDINGWK